jgi:hypothetical protein
MNRFKFALVFACTLILNVVLLSQNPSPSAAPTLKPGTMIKCQIDSDLSSASASKDDSVDFKILFATDDGKRVVLPHGAKLRAKVLNAKSALKERTGLLTLKLAQLVFPDGHTEDLQGEVQFMSLKDVTIETNGTELTLHGRSEESNTLSVQSTASVNRPASSVDDIVNGDRKKSEPPKKTTSGGLDLTKRKGHDVEISVGAAVNIRILEPASAAPSK